MPGETILVNPMTEMVLKWDHGGGNWLLRVMVGWGPIHNPVIECSRLKHTEWWANNGLRPYKFFGLFPSCLSSLPPPQFFGGGALGLKTRQSSKKKHQSTTPPPHRGGGVTTLKQLYEADPRAEGRRISAKTLQLGAKRPGV